MLFYSGFDLISKQLYLARGLKLVAVILTSPKSIAMTRQGPVVPCEEPLNDATTFLT